MTDYPTHKVGSAITHAYDHVSDTHSVQLYLLPDVNIKLATVFRNVRTRESMMVTDAIPESVQVCGWDQDGNYHSKELKGGMTCYTLMCYASAHKAPDITCGDVLERLTIAMEDG